MTKHLPTWLLLDISNALGALAGVSGLAVVWGVVAAMWWVGSR